MGKNAMPPKTKRPPADSSEEETGSSDEETEDEEQAEGGCTFESGSNESTDTTKKKLISIVPPRQRSAVKAAAPAAAPGNTAKRTRESNGKKDKEDEPPNKKKKTEVKTPTPRAAPKPTTQLSQKKSATGTGRGKPTPPVKEQPSTTKKKSATKRKNVSPAPKTRVSSRSEDGTQQKPKSLSWSPDEELALSRELQRDRVNDVYGSSLPSSRSDPYWEKLMKRFSFMDKYEKEQRIERLCEKVGRMRVRYESLCARLRADAKSVYKDSHEADLWRIWHTIWGPGKVTPKMLNCEDFEEDDEEEEARSDEGSEEDDVEEIEPTQFKGRQAAPPAVLAVPASAETSGAGMQAPVPKSVSTKGPAVSAMVVDSGRNTSSFAVHNGAHDGHALIPAMIEKSVRANALLNVSSEMHEENLALLHDMRGTCVKMVEEAKAQTQKIWEETRVQTTQIMEELRTAVGQSGRTNGTFWGRWSGMFDNPFQGMGLLGNGELPLDDPINVKWREQNEAEHGLILQRLQLVQEQARIQQESIRLKLNIQKQQASAQGKQAQ